MAPAPMMAIFMNGSLGSCEPVRCPAPSVMKLASAESARRGEAAWLNRCAERAIYPGQPAAACVQPPDSADPVGLWRAAAFRRLLPRRGHGVSRRSVCRQCCDLATTKDSELNLCKAFASANACPPDRPSKAMGCSVSRTCPKRATPLVYAAGTRGLRYLESRRRRRLHMWSISTWKPRPSPCRTTHSAEALFPRFPTVSHFGRAGSHRLFASQVVPWEGHSSTRNRVASRKSSDFGQVTDRHHDGTFFGGRKKHTPPA